MSPEIIGNPGPGGARGTAVDKCDAAKGVVYASIGTAGPNNTVPFLPFKTWVTSFEHGVTRFDVLNASHLRGTFVRSSDGGAIDEFLVVREAGR